MRINNETILEETDIRVVTYTDINHIIRLLCRCTLVEPMALLGLH